MRNRRESIVAFHIGRGGEFFNPGYVTYLSDVHCLQDLYDDKVMIVAEDEDGNEMPVENHVLLDMASDSTLLSGQAIYAKTGVLDFDGEYDKYIVCDLNHVPTRCLSALFCAVSEGDVTDKQDLECIIDYLEDEGYDMAGYINTLEKLAAYINVNENWNIEVENIIERNGWHNETGETFGVCSDDTNRIVLNDACQATVIVK